MNFGKNFNVYIMNELLKSTKLEAIFAIAFKMFMLIFIKDS